MMYFRNFCIDSTFYTHFTCRMPIFSAPLHLAQILARLILTREKSHLSGSRMRISLEWTINRKSENPESPKTVSESNFVPLTNDICKEMNTVLNSTGTENNVTIPYLMPKFLKVTSIGKASPVAKLMKNEDQSKLLSLL